MNILLFTITNKMFVILFTYLFTLSTAALVIKPENIIAPLSFNVTIHCVTNLNNPVVWRFADINELTAMDYFFGRNHTWMWAYYRNVHIDNFSTKNAYNVIVNSVSIYNQGRYECHDNRGHYKFEHRSGYLFVLRNLPDCVKSIQFLNSSFGNVSVECSFDYLYSNDIKLISVRFLDTNKIVSYKDRQTIIASCVEEYGVKWGNVVVRMSIPKYLFNLALTQIRIVLGYQWYNSLMKSSVYKIV